MGYDVHITRRRDLNEEEGPVISIEEWKAYLSGDAEFRLDGFAEAPLPDGRVFRIESEGLAVWTAYTRQADGRIGWFDCCDGNVVVKNPDAEILAKMWRIAQALSARVVGDDGEEYDATGEQVQEPSGPPKRPWWKLW